MLSICANKFIYNITKIIGEKSFIFFFRCFNFEIRTMQESLMPPICNPPFKQPDKIDVISLPTICHRKQRDIPPALVILTDAYP